jgi:HSP20 family molecular chaperone IbpA
VGVGVVSVSQEIWLDRKIASTDPAPSAEENSESFYDQLFNADFFNRSKDPFAEMDRMHKQLMKDFNSGGLSEDFFGSWYKKKFGGGEAAEIKQREDKDYVYYDISIAGIDPRNLHVNVDDRQVNISGTEEKKTENKTDNNSEESYFSTKFERSFPAPQGTDPSKVEIQHEKDKVILKFPKTTV